MIISFLIVNRNGGDVFKKGIASMVENAKEAGIKHFEIVVIDNASSDDISWMKKVPQIILKRNKVNHYFSIPTNDSVKYSKGDILFILNNDIILQKGCLLNLLKVMDDPSVDAAIPQLRYPNGTPQQSIAGIPAWKDVLYAAFGLHIFFPKNDKWRLRAYDYSKKHVVKDQPMFSALMVRRDTWKKVGGLDPKLPLLWNDVDWFYRFHKLQLKCVYAPLAVASHVHGMSVNKLVWKKLYLLSEGCYIFLTKHSINKSFIFKSFIWLLCVLTYFERIPIEIVRIISSKNKKG